MDDPNITMEEYIGLEEEKAQRHGQTFNWQTTTFEKVKYYQEEDDCFTKFKTESPCGPTVSLPNEKEIDFIISLDESDDEDYTLDTAYWLEISKSLNVFVLAPNFPAVVVSEPADPTSTPSSTSIDQDASSPSTSQTPQESQSLVIPSDKFSKGAVDPTLFTQKEGKDILLISQSPRGIFLNQSKYALEIIKKYGMESCVSVDTPMVEKTKMDKDPQGKAVDPTCYHGMIGSIMCLTSSEPGLVFVVCMCAWYRAKPIERHLYAVNRNF
nr:hypothetical protein [Tanacetum cinerariifolium]